MLKKQNKGTLVKVKKRATMISDFHAFLLSVLGKCFVYFLGLMIMMMIIICFTLFYLFAHLNAAPTIYNDVTNNYVYQGDNFNLVGSAIFNNTTLNDVIRLGSPDSIGKYYKTAIHPPLESL